MNESAADASAGLGNPLAIPGRRYTVQSHSGEPAIPTGDGQQLRQLFIDLRGRIRDPHAGLRAGRRARQVTLAVDEEVYQAFQALCRQHDLTVAMALQLMMSGRELPAARPEVLQLPAVIDADALRVLDHLESSIASCQAAGALGSGEAGRIHDLLAGLCATIGSKTCPCSGRERERSARTVDGQREDA